MTPAHNPELFIRELEDGLVLRHAGPQDAEALADFNSRLLSDDGPEKPHAGIGAWTRDLLSRPHPTLVPGDFTIVEQRVGGRIVSAMGLIPQTWTYEGIEFGVGRPELVCTLPEFRRRGLVRAQFEEVHRWSAQRGHLVQAITGIPNFYRQFGYEMALNFVGYRSGAEANLPKAKDGGAASCRLRPAREADLEFVGRLYAQSQARYAVSCKRTPEIHRYEFDGQSRASFNHFELVIIEGAQGERLGYFQHPNDLFQNAGMYAVGFELVPGASWLEVSPLVAHYLWAKGREIPQQGSALCSAYGFMLGDRHPAYDALEDCLPAVCEPYAIYLRVPDLPAFLARIRPALEARLAVSIAAGYSGGLKLSFYRSGLHLVFEKGCLTGIGPHHPGPDIDEDAAFPDLTFLQLLFGYRSLAELHHAFRDCFWEHNTARVLLEALFPKRPSDVFPLS